MTINTMAMTGLIGGGLALLLACGHKSTGGGELGPDAASTTNVAMADTEAIQDRSGIDMSDEPDVNERIVKSEEDWKRELSAEEYRILRLKGTEPPFTHEYAKSGNDGLYRCAACGNPLFSSDDKFDSGTGWPSYTRPVQEGRVEQHEDRALGMVRTEVVCARCGGHLGHVFPDGPHPTGLRYCINGVSLKMDRSE